MTDSVTKISYSNINSSTQQNQINSCIRIIVITFLQLLIGCDDSFIRVLKNNQFITEISETGPILCLSPINEVRFAYGLANGTIGIYEEGIRLWRVKVCRETRIRFTINGVVFLLNVNTYCNFNIYSQNKMHWLSNGLGRL